MSAYLACQTRIRAGCRGCCSLRRGDHHRPAARRLQVDSGDGGVPTGECDGQTSVCWQSEVHGDLGRPSGTVRAVRRGELGSGVERSRDGSEPGFWLCRDVERRRGALRDRESRRAGSRRAQADGERSPASHAGGRRGRRRRGRLSRSRWGGRRLSRRRRVRRRLLTPARPDCRVAACRRRRVHGPDGGSHTEASPALHADRGLVADTTHSHEATLARLEAVILEAVP